MKYTSPYLVDVNSKAVSQEFSGSGQKMGSPAMYMAPGPGAVGSKIRTASSGAGEYMSRSRVFQPHGNCISITPAYMDEILSQYMFGVPSGFGS